jgi:hypothetical protein
MLAEKLKMHDKIQCNMQYKQYCEHFYSHDFELLLLVNCIILLWNQGKPQAYHKLVCTLENCQWCREPYFAGTALSFDGKLLQIARQDMHMSLQT